MANINFTFGCSSLQIVSRTSSKPFTRERFEDAENQMPIPVAGPTVKRIKNARLKVDKSISIENGEVAGVGPFCKDQVTGTYIPRMEEMVYVQGPGTVKYPSGLIGDCMVKVVKGPETIPIVNHSIQMLVDQYNLVNNHNNKRGGQPDSGRIKGGGRISPLNQVTLNP